MDFAKRSLLLATVILGAGCFAVAAGGCGDKTDDAPAPAGVKPETKVATPEQQAERGNLRGGGREQHN